MLASEPARCRKCGNEQYYTKVITWNTWLNPEYPANNKCCKCGTEIKYDDIDMLTCSPYHRSEVRSNKIHERLSSKENNGNNDKEVVCPKCGNTKLSYSSICGIKLPEKYKDKENYQVKKSYYDCSECGHTTYLTLEEILSCGLYEFIENGKEEHEYIVKYVDNYQEIMDEWDRKRKEELEQIENELISEGLITTREEEKEYSDKYYEELHRKYGQ
jgi:hypothetical protein